MDIKWEINYDKLVRDNIPEIIQSNWARALTHIASKQEFSEKLKDKLIEEVQEYLESGDIQELADILEVVYTLAKNQNITKEKLEEMRTKKESQRWWFSKKIILEKTISLLNDNISK
jgi:predicted house-cleaning noncanonical NTP pyrophosphatase (MazG superfamily)